MSVETLPGQQAVRGQAWSKVRCTGALKSNLYNAGREQIGRWLSASSTSLFHFYFLFFAMPQVCILFVLSTSLKICLTVSFVSSSHVLMSSALNRCCILLFLFLRLSMAACNYFFPQLWNFFHLFHTDTLISFVIFRLVLVDFQLCFCTSVVCIQSAVENPKDIGNYFS